jgi:TetR/AcrR family transcriptional regulator
MVQTRGARGSRAKGSARSATKSKTRKPRVATSSVEVASNTESRLLECALTIFAEKGYSATSVRQIIDAAGVTQPTLYYYCNDKADLFQRLVRQKYEESHQQLDAVLQQIDGCEARLRTLVRRSFEYCVADPRIPRLMFQTYFGPPIEGIAEFLDELTATRFALVTRLMRDGVKSGELKRADSEFLALSFCNLMDQPINLFARKPQPKRYLTPQLADAIVELFLHGVGN